jgi:hypothetical protein
MLSSVIVASLDPTRSFRGGVVAVEPVIVNAELDKERAVFGVELVPSRSRSSTLASMAEKVPAGHRSAGAAGGRGVVGGFVPSDVAAGSAGR